MAQNNISLEKVINGLECCLEGLSDLCSYKDSDAPGGCKDELMYDALVLLKADLQAQRETQAALETEAHMEQWEPTYNPEDGSL